MHFNSLLDRFRRFPKWHKLHIFMFRILVKSLMMLNADMALVKDIGGTYLYCFLGVERYEVSSKASVFMNVKSIIHVSRRTIN